MKILLLTTHLNTGGISVYTVNLARYLKKEGVDITVVSSGGDLEDVLARDEVPHIAMDIRTKSEFGIKMWKTLPLLAKLIKNGGFQLVHVQTRVAQVLGWMSERITGVPFISTCHGFFKHRRLSRRFFPCWGEKTIAISKSVREHLLEDFHLKPDRIALIYNGVELERYPFEKAGKDHAFVRSIGISENATIVGTVGRLSPVKGFEYLIDAFKDVVSRKSDIRLLIVGEGPEEDTLKKQVRRLEIADKVLFVSRGAPLEKYLSVLDIFCLPSVREGLGLSLMEAMAAGRACIASDVGGLSELITHGKDGVLVPPKDPGALSAAILDLAGDVPFRQQLAENAHRKAMDTFSIRDSVAKTIKVYEEVIGTRLGE
jgi:glycosyltransferase involved in cell wall biosynthesis